MSRALVLLLMAVGLVVGALVLARPPAGAGAPGHAAGEAQAHDCHGQPGPAAVADAPQSRPAHPCCPDGCDGHCLMPAAALPAAAVGAPVGWMRGRLKAPDARLPAARAPAAPEHPPRPLA